MLKQQLEQFYYENPWLVTVVALIATYVLISFSYPSHFLQKKNQLCVCIYHITYVHLKISKYVYMRVFRSQSRRER